MRIFLFCLILAFSCQVGWSETFEETKVRADQGDAEAQYNLGVMYDDGKGVPRNDAKAFEWYTKAAEQGHADSQYNLGVIYTIGRGVPKNYAKIFELYTKAAEQGHVNAKNVLREMHDRGAPSSYFRIKGENVPIMNGPSHSSGQKINETATKYMKSPNVSYLTFGKEWIVRTIDKKGDWLHVEGINHEDIRVAYKGWIESRFIRELQYDKKGFYIYTEEDFYFSEDSYTGLSYRYKDIVIKAINYLHKYDPRCVNIVPSSTSLSTTKKAPHGDIGVFYVRCEKGDDVYNIFFTKNEIESKISKDHLLGDQ
jgi:TPR repeat protein